MPKVHSHYENLKVARDASPQAIRLAYRALTRRHHPDRNAGDADASRVMAAINVAYAVLSDPVQRALHDEWIGAAEQGQPTDQRVEDIAQPAPSIKRGPSRPHVSPFTTHQPSAQVGPPRAPRAAPRALRKTHRYAVWAKRHPAAVSAMGLALLSLTCAAIWFALALPHVAAVDLQGLASAAPAGQAGYVRQATAPNGARWPERSGYVSGYPLQNTGGLSDVTIDNTRNDADMFAKLVCLDGREPLAVRTVFVRAHGSFKLTGLSYGSYDLRYRNLSDGRLSRSQFFTLEEIAMAEGVRHSSVTMPLHETRDGEIMAYGLTEAEF